MVTKLHAILVGINQYQSEKLQPYPLSGCLNDVNRMANALTGLFAANEIQITVLQQEQATRAGIISAFRQQLVQPASQWAAAGRPMPAPAFLFHFSGHGSMMRDDTGVKPNGLDETIVPYDSRQADVFDLRDWELGSLIDELGQYTENITIILDCCHAGSGTRGDGPAIRKCPPDDRIQSSIRSSNTATGSGATGNTIARRVSPQSMTRGLRGGSEIEIAKYVVLAACNAREAAAEYYKEDEGRTIVFGAMSYALTEELGRLNSPGITYRELHEKVCARLRAWHMSQTPQVEGDRDRILFSTDRVERDLLFSAGQIEGSTCQIDVGLIHGFCSGDEFDVYPPGARSSAIAGDPLARIRVIDAGAVNCLCQVISGISPVPQNARLRSARRHGGHQSILVRLQSIPPSQRSKLNAALQRLQSSDGISVSDASDSVFCIDYDNVANQWRLFDVNGLQLACASELTSVSDLERTLQTYIRQLKSLRISNHSSSHLDRLLTCEIEQLFTAGLPTEGTVDQYRLIHPDNGGKRTIVSGTPVRFVIRNDSTESVYCQVLSFGYDGSVSRIWPRLQGEQITLEPDRSIRTKRFRMMFAPTDKQTQAACEYIKVFAASVPLDLDILCTTGLRSDGLTFTDCDWTTAELAFQLVRS